MESELNVFHGPRHALPWTQAKTCCSDILSYYKEQLSVDTVNRVSLTSRCRGIAPTIVLDELVEEAIAAHSRVLATLAPHARARDAYLSFSHGYVGFHAGLARYRLSELRLLDEDVVTVPQSSTWDFMVSLVRRFGKSW